MVKKALKTLALSFNEERRPQTYLSHEHVNEAELLHFLFLLQRRSL